MLSQISAKNLSGSPITLTRIGLTVGAGSTQDLSTYAHEYEIIADSVLLSSIQSDDMVLVVDGIELSKSESLRLFSIEVGPPTIPIKILSDANIASLSGLPGVIDGTTAAAGDSILLTAQTDQTENGPWIVQSGAWVRPPSYPAGANISGAIFSIIQGTTYNEQLWVCNVPEGSDVIGTNNLFFFQKVSGGGDDPSHAQGITIALPRYNVEYELQKDLSNVTIV